MAVLPDDAGWREATQHVQQWTAMPLLILSMFIMSIAPPQVDLPAGAKSPRGCGPAIWITFAADYVSRLSLAVTTGGRPEHLLDVGVVLPMLRALRVLGCRGLGPPRLLPSSVTKNG